MARSGAMMAVWAVLALSPSTALAQGPVIDWSSQVANLNADTGSIRIESAGEFGCEMTLLDPAGKSSLVVYGTPDGLGVTTLIPPAEWLEDGDDQMTSLVMTQSGNLAIRQALFKKVQDPNRGTVLRTQHLDTLPQDLGKAIGLTIGSVNEARSPLSVDFAGGQSAQALTLFDSCLAWTSANAPAQ